MNQAGQRFCAFTFKNRQLAKNRIVVPAMASQTATEAGFVSEQTLAHYHRLTNSDAGLVIVEYTYVHQSGRSENNQLANDHDDKLEGLAALAQTIKKTNRLAGIQLTHGGGKSSHDLTDGRVLAPSDTAVPHMNGFFDAPKPMTTVEIEDFKQAFLLSTERAFGAGFDLVEYHAAHGYGLNQWISPYSNKRTDGYGNSRDNRFKILQEIVLEARRRFPNKLFSVWIPGQDLIEGGLSQEDAIALARMLEHEGIDLINVSSGLGGWRRPRDRLGEGYMVPEATAIARAVTVPVIGVGGIQTAAYIDAQIASHAISFAAVGRAILKNPLQWRQEVMCGA